MDEAAARVQLLLVELARNGLQRVTAGTTTELDAASQWAHHAKLTKVERELVALRTHVERYLARDPLFSTDALVDRMDRLAWRLGAVRARLAAGEEPESFEALIGVPRRTYEPVDEALLMVPLAMRAWCSDTDFMGVTTTFWAPQRSQQVEAGLARPMAYFGTDPRRLAWQLVNDSMGITMQELSHGAWKVEGIRLARDGRVSLTQDAYAQPAAFPLVDALAPIACSDALAILERLQPDVLAPLDGGLGQWVYLELASFGPRHIDDTHAVARCALTDQRGCTVQAVVPLKPENELLIENLAHLRMAESRPDGLIAWARVSGDALTLLPATAVFHDAVDFVQRRRTMSVQLVHLSVEPLGMVRR
jgi:hypothetical protein